MLPQYQGPPQELHIKALYLISHFLWNNPNKILVIDPSPPNVDKYVFNLNADWKEFYRDVVEEDPHKIL